MGIVIAVLVLALYMPLFQLSNVVNRRPTEADTKYVVLTFRSAAADN